VRSKAIREPQEGARCRASAGKEVEDEEQEVHVAEPGGGKAARPCVASRTPLFAGLEAEHKLLAARANCCAAGTELECHDNVVIGLDAPATKERTQAPHHSLLDDGGTNGSVVFREEEILPWTSL
jgi:hypothetical protein